MGSIAKKGLQQYLMLLQHHPLKSNYGRGVIRAQQIVSQKLSSVQKLRLRRLLLNVLFGAVHRGPFEHSLHIIRQNFQGEEGSENSSKEDLTCCELDQHRYVPLQFRVILQTALAIFLGTISNRPARTVALPKTK